MLSLLLAVTTAVTIENQKPGTSGWDITKPALAREIEGYASATSVNRGETIDLFVNTAAPRYRIDVYRLGWYGGIGARQVAGPIERDGVAQSIPAPDPTTGLVECRWRDPYPLRTADTSGPWPSGVYLARLTESRAGAQAFIVFVVRDDLSQSAIVFQSSVATFEAFNNWGGQSLYAFNSGNDPARKVSFDRPYAMEPYGVRLDGAGELLRRWEYNALRWLEREGYDVTYSTDVDTDERGDLLVDHRIFLAAGHDEYWSWAMRENVEAARDRGVSLAFLGADVGYWQIRFEPDADGRPDRTIVCYKEAAGSEDPFAIDRIATNNRFITGRWRDRPISRPEDRLVGIMYAADPVDGDIVVDRADHWAFEGTGLKRGDALRGLLGNEVDAIYGGAPAPLVRLAHSPFTQAARTGYGDMTIYTAASGAIVFAAGSNQWSWGLDDYNAPAWRRPLESRAAERITRNILARMLAVEPTPAPSPSGASRPSAIVIVAALAAVAVVARTWWRVRHTTTRTDPFH